MTNDDDTESTDQARRPRPVTPQLRAQVAELHSGGMGRNAIAREVGVSTATVTKIAREAGLTFDREATAFATKVRLIELADARATLAKSFAVRAQELLDALDEPVTLGNFGGRDNTWNETLLDEPTIEGKRSLIQAAATAARAATELSKADTADVSRIAALGMLDLMHGALGGAIDALEQVGELPDPTITPEQGK